MIFLLTIVFLSACNRSQTVQTQNPSYPNEPVKDMPGVQPYTPQPGDDVLTRGEVFLDSTEILVMESYPMQIMLVLKGSLPTPCNQLRVADNPPDKQNQIHIEVYSVIDQAQACVQVLESFEANIPLGSFPSGHYSVWINGEMIGEFDS